MGPQEAMLVGSLMGTCLRPEFPLKVTKVEPEYDGEGNYLNTFVVELFSGRKLRVTVEEE